MDVFDWRIIQQIRVAFYFSRCEAKLTRVEKRGRSDIERTRKFKEFFRSVA